jgi:hypothetical protein
MPPAPTHYHGLGETPRAPRPYVDDCDGDGEVEPLPQRNGWRKTSRILYLVQAARQVDLIELNLGWCCQEP